LLATLRKNFRTDLHEIFREGLQWANEQMIKCWWRSGSAIPIRIRIATLVKRALAEVCTIPVLLVNFVLVPKQFLTKNVYDKTALINIAMYGFYMYWAMI